MFRALPEPTNEDVLDVAQRTAQRVVGILSKHGRSLEGLDEEAERGNEVVVRAWGHPQLASSCS